MKRRYPFCLVVMGVLGALSPALGQQSSQGGRLGINEVYFETLESKYYSQAIEIHNGSDAPVDLSLHRLIVGNTEETNNTKVFVGSRTNNIITWTDSKQEQFSQAFTNISFSSFLPPGQIAGILDPGYNFREDFGFNYENRTNTLYLLTTSTGSLGTGNFLKEDDIIRFIDTTTHPEKTIDAFYNRNTSPGYAIVKIDSSKSGLIDNTTTLPQTIGYWEDLTHLYSTQPPDRITLDEVAGNILIVGLPQDHSPLCKYLTTISKLCNQTVHFQRHDLIKMYHYPSGSANLITDSDAIVFTAGLSNPITLFALESGHHQINMIDAHFPPIEKTVFHFNHSRSDDIFITEIYYDTNKNLTWMEVFSQTTITIPLVIQTFNSDYRQNHIFYLSNTALTNGYNVLGYRNEAFNQRFPTSDPVISLSNQLGITAKGIIALSSENEYLDIVHYDKNWFEESIEGRSLQRINTTEYAFTKSQWDVSTEVNSTPFAINTFVRDIRFTIDLISTRLSLSTLKVHYLADFNVGGDLTAYLYDQRGYRVGKVFSQEVSRSYRQPLFLCLKEVNQRYGLFPGEYSLMFLFKSSDGTKTLFRKFTLE